MSEFEEHIDQKAATLRREIERAKAEDNDFLRERLIEELESLESLAAANDVDTSQLQQVISIETGQLPVVTDDQLNEQP